LSNGHRRFRGFPAALTFTIAALVVNGCAHPPEVTSAVVARVGNRNLTEAQLATWGASLGLQGADRETRAAYINRWVEDELLYQAAVDRGLLQDAWVAEKRDDLLRQLLTARLLELESRQIPQPTAAEITQYYREHSAEFVWQQRHLVVDYWRSDASAGMESLRNSLVRGREDWIWTGAAGGLDNGQITMDGPGSAAPDVWNICATLKVGQVTPVTRFNDVSWIFKLIDRREPGTTRDIEDASGEIAQRLFEAVRDRRRTELVSRLTEQFQRQGKLTISIPATPDKTPDTSGTASDSEQTKYE